MPEMFQKVRKMSVFRVNRFVGKGDERARELAGRHDVPASPVCGDHMSHRVFSVGAVALVLQRGNEPFHCVSGMDIGVVRNPTDLTEQANRQRLASRFISRERVAWE